MLQDIPYNLKNRGKGNEFIGKLFNLVAIFLIFLAKKGYFGKKLAEKFGQLSKKAYLCAAFEFNISIRRDVRELRL